MFRVRTDLKALRAVGGSSFKLWDSKEILTGLNTLPAVRKTKGLRTPEKSRPIPAGGKRQRGAEMGKLSPREATPSHTANRPRVLSEDFLRPDRRRALGPRREKARHTR